MTTTLLLRVHQCDQVEQQQQRRRRCSDFFRHFFVRFGPSRPRACSPRPESMWGTAAPPVHILKCRAAIFSFLLFVLLFIAVFVAARLSFRGHLHFRATRRCQPCQRPAVKICSRNMLKAGSAFLLLLFLVFYVFLIFLGHGRHCVLDVNIPPRALLVKHGVSLAGRTYPVQTGGRREGVGCC